MACYLLGMFLTVDETRIYYRLEGNEGRPLVVMAHSLGTDHGQWQPQMDALLQEFQVLRYDIRGHGASGAPAGDYTLEQLGRDVLALAGAARAERFAFCGLSLGGMIGQWLGVHAGDRLTHLVLANTSPKVADPGIFEERRKTVLAEGMGKLAEAAIGRFFLPETVASGLPAVATIRRVLLATPPAGYAGCCAAIRDMDFTGVLDRIALPVLVVAGDRDQSLPWTGHGEILASRIPGAQAVHLPTAHLSNVEQPEAFNRAIVDFLRKRANT
jgi:3-oxoadipate enol-lactonase